MTELEKLEFLFLDEELDHNPTQAPEYVTALTELLHPACKATAQKSVPDRAGQ